MAHRSSSAPRRQRRELYNADSFHRHRRMAVPLSRELRARFHCRSIPVRKGDTVRILSGSYVGSEERVARVDRRSYTVILNNITLKTGEQKQKPLPIRTAHLLLTKLNLSDAWRRRVLSVAAEELTPEELGTPTPEETPVAPAAVSPPAAPEEETMKLTDAEREFIEDAGTEEDRTETKVPPPPKPSTKAPPTGGPRTPAEGEGKRPSPKTEPAEEDEIPAQGSPAKAVRPHSAAAKNPPEPKLDDDAPPKGEATGTKPHAPAKNRTRPHPSKSEDDAS